MIDIAEIIPKELEALRLQYGALAVATAARTTLCAELKKYLTAKARLAPGNADDAMLTDLAMLWRPQPPKNKAAAKLATMISAMSAEQRAEVLESLKKLDGSAA